MLRVESAGFGISDSLESRPGLVAWVGRARGPTAGSKLLLSMAHSLLS